MADAGEALLRLGGVYTDIGRYQILYGVDLTVRRGRVTMLLGRNGAGKTTTLRTIMGLWKARAGEITFDGRSIAGGEAPDIARLGIAYVPENMGIFGRLTVRENMLLATGAQGFAKDQLDRVLTFFPALKLKWESAAGSLSGGQKQMLAIGRAIVEQRRLLLVDEPTKGLSPAMVDQLVEALLQMKQEQATILLVEQNFRVALAMGDDVAVMDQGRIVHSGEMVVLGSDEGLQQRLLDRHQPDRRRHDHSRVHYPDHRRTWFGGRLLHRRHTGRLDQQLCRLPRAQAGAGFEHPADGAHSALAAARIVPGSRALRGR